jgi:hypothetical protein
VAPANIDLRHFISLFIKFSPAELRVKIENYAAPRKIAHQAS